MNRMRSPLFLFFLCFSAGCSSSPYKELVYDVEFKLPNGYSMYGGSDRTRRYTGPERESQFKVVLGDTYFEPEFWENSKVRPAAWEDRLFGEAYRRFHSDIGFSRGDCQLSGSPSFERKILDRALMSQERVECQKQGESREHWSLSLIHVKMAESVVEFRFVEKLSDPKNEALATTQLWESLINTESGWRRSWPHRVATRFSHWLWYRSVPRQERFKDWILHREGSLPEAVAVPEGSRKALWNLSIYLPDVEESVEEGSSEAQKYFLIADPSIRLSVARALLSPAQMSRFYHLVIFHNAIHIEAKMQELLDRTGKLCDWDRRFDSSHHPSGEAALFWHRLSCEESDLQDTYLVMIYAINSDESILELQMETEDWSEEDLKTLTKQILHSIERI